ncbi:hypothetical protein [Cryocola sp. 340MFSha3.1]|uniref:fascin domain-containing protein n=1 Tax=Cryocola sp. 340MFSha3.1 TaxID=1169145 RepID=UPI000365DEF2|nr:hypothetical protein [Cryocola sp. 340MFSha3.1]
MRNVSRQYRTIAAAAIMAITGAGLVMPAEPAAASAVDPSSRVSAQAQEVGHVTARAELVDPGWTTSNPARVGDAVAIRTTIANTGSVALDGTRWNRADDPGSPWGVREDPLQPGEQFVATLKHVVTPLDLRVGYIDYTVEVSAYWEASQGGYRVLSARSQAVTVLPAAVVGDVQLVAQVNGLYVTAEDEGERPLMANRSQAGLWEQFTVLNNGDGTISLRAGANGKYVVAEDEGASALIANRTAIGPWEKFTVVPNRDGTISLLAVANGKYVSADNAGTGALIANRTTIGAAEKFLMQ